MTSSRDTILNKLRAARQPFPDAPLRPAQYLPVAPIDDFSPEGLFKRFSFELDRLMGQAFLVDSDEAALSCVLDLLLSHNTSHMIAWDFAHIPLNGLESAVRETGIQITQADMRDEFRAETLETIRDVQVGLTGVDVAVAATGTMVFSTAPGKGRLPTVFAPVHIAVLTLDQILPRLEDWVARQRADSLETLQKSANICFVSGPSRTADIEMEMILGVHGPGKVQVVVKR
jgi:L-lactate dehydrogenase complex protein LldG